MYFARFFSPLIVFFLHFTFIYSRQSIFTMFNFKILKSLQIYQYNVSFAIIAAGVITLTTAFSVNIIILFHVSMIMFFCMNIMMSFYLNTIKFFYVNIIVSFHLNTVKFFHVNILVFFYLNTVRFFYVTILIFFYLNTIKFFYVNIIFARKTDGNLPSIISSQYS